MSDAFEPEVADGIVATYDVTVPVTLRVTPVLPDGARAPLYCTTYVGKGTYGPDGDEVSFELDELGWGMTGQPMLSFPDGSSVHLPLKELLPAALAALEALERGEGSVHVHEEKEESDG